MFSDAAHVKSSEASDVVYVVADFPTPLSTSRPHTHIRWWVLPCRGTGEACESANILDLSARALRQTTFSMQVISDFQALSCGVQNDSFRPRYFVESPGERISIVMLFTVVCVGVRCRVVAE